MSFNNICNSAVNFSQNLWKVVSQDMPELVKTGKLSDSAKKRCFSLVCTASKLGSLILGITFVAAALFSGPLGTIGFGIGAVFMYDTYKIAAKAQKHALGHPDSRAFLKDTIICKRIALFIALILSKLNEPYRN